MLVLVLGVSVKLSVRVDMLLGYGLVVLLIKVRIAPCSCGMARPGRGHRLLVLGLVLRLVLAPSLGLVLRLVLALIVLRSG